MKFNIHKFISTLFKPIGVTHKQKATRTREKGNPGKENSSKASTPIVDRISRAVTILSALVRGRARARFDHMARVYIAEVDRLVGAHGIRQAAKMLKAFFSQGKRVAFGYRDDFVEYPIWTRSCVKTQMPLRLRVITEWLTSSRMKRVMALSLLATYMLIRVSPETDIASIAGKWSGKGLPGDFPKYFWSSFMPWIRSLGLSRFRPPKDLFLYKKGVWNMPCIDSVGADSWVFLFSYIHAHPVALGVLEITRYFGGPEYVDDLLTRMKRLATRPPVSDWRFMRTSSAPDRGGKTRTFTCGSYWIQWCLYPIHTYCMDLLRRIPEDYTYRHKEASDLLKRWHKEGRPVYSYDLTSATDRFPLWVQTYLVCGLFSREVGKAWTDIMRSWSYIDDDEAQIEAMSKYCRYETGQPMGIYSSWAVFALAHHMIVRYAAWRLGIDPDGQYAILGDDIVIANEVLATEYHRIMTVLLGVLISLAKSYAPDLPKGINSGEFAKQLVSRGRVITPLTPDLLEEIQLTSWHLIADVVAHVTRYWNVKWGIHHTCLPTLFKCSVPLKHFKRAFWHLAWPKLNLIPKYYRTGKGVASAPVSWKLPEWWPTPDHPNLVWYDDARKEKLLEKLEKELGDWIPSPRHRLRSVKTEADLMRLLRTEWNVPHVSGRLLVRLQWKLLTPDIKLDLDSLETHLRALISTRDFIHGRSRVELSSLITRTHGERLGKWRNRPSEPGWIGPMDSTKISNALRKIGFWQLKTW